MKQLHQVLVRGSAGGLHHEDVAGAHVLLDLDGDFAVGEAAHFGLRPVRRPRWVAISCASTGLALPVKSTVLNSTVDLSAVVALPSRRHGTALRGPSGVVRPRRGPQQMFWQGRKDSNPRMSESKSDALTNLATPLHRKRLSHRHPRNSASALPNALQGVLHQAAAQSAPPNPAASPSGLPNGLCRHGWPGRHRTSLRRPRCRSPSCGCCRNRASNQLAACATSGHRSSAGAAGRS